MSYKGGGSSPSSEYSTDSNQSWPRYHRMLRIKYFHNTFLSLLFTREIRQSKKYRSKSQGWDKNSPLAPVATSRQGEQRNNFQKDSLVRGRKVRSVKDLV